MFYLGKYVPYHDFGCGALILNVKKLGQFLSKDERVERIFLYFFKWRNADWLAYILVLNQIKDYYNSLLMLNNRSHANVPCQKNLEHDLELFQV